MEQELNILNWPKIQILDSIRDMFKQQDGDWHWDPVDAISKIRISDKNEIMFDVQDEDRPVISISRGAIRNTGQIIADHAATDIHTSAQTFTEIIDTSITVNCLARNGLEAEQLATMVYGYIKYNRESIMEKGFLRLDPPIISEEQVISASSDFNMFNVSVVFSVVYAIKWTRVYDDAYELKEISVKVRSVNGV